MKRVRPVIYERPDTETLHSKLRPQRRRFHTCVASNDAVHVVACVWIEWERKGWCYRRHQTRRHLIISTSISSHLKRATSNDVLYSLPVVG